MEDDITMFTADSGCYLESLVRCRGFLLSQEGFPSSRQSLLDVLDQVLHAELELALMAADKAKSEITKLSKNNIKTIK